MAPRRTGRAFAEHRADAHSPKRSAASRRVATSVSVVSGRACPLRRLEIAHLHPGRPKEFCCRREELRRLLVDAQRPASVCDLPALDQRLAIAALSEEGMRLSRIGYSDLDEAERAVVDVLVRVAEHLDRFPLLLHGRRERDAG